MSYQPKTGARCACKRGVQRDNCPTCEGTGWVIDFAAIRARTKARMAGALSLCPTCRAGEHRDCLSVDAEGNLCRCDDPECQEP